MLVIITGASKGIGFELVKKFSQINGCLVMAISRNIGSVIKLANESKNHSIYPLKIDITNNKELDSLLKLIKKINIPVDILINNAGTIINKPFEKITESELLGVYQTNVFAPFKLIQLLVPKFNNSQTSHIVNISSMGGFQGSSKFPGLSAYSSSKAALAGLTECLAEELKSKNIHVNCLALGAVQTEMLSKAFPNYKAPLKANQMANFIFEFAINGHQFFNGKIIPVSSTTP
jgi:short-subunit dehydrogenase